jgi:predicted NUDIX family NTP pyrophosphohydrolase
VTETIFEDFGIEILKRGEAFFIRYDAGHFNISMTEFEVTADEVEKARRSEQDAYEVCMDHKMRTEQGQR